MADGVYIANQEYDIEYVNPVLEKDFGSWEGRKCYEYFHDRKESCSWCKSKDVFAGKTVRWEWYSTKNRKTYDLIDTPLKNPDGSLSKLEIFRDITERKKVEEQLEQSREFLANTINALDDTFFVKDEEHRWTILNDAACEVIGRHREELIGKSDYDLVPKEQADIFWENDNLVFETGETSVNEENVTWQGELHTISTKKSLFRDFITGKRFIVGTARDITDRKKAEEALHESEQKYRALVEQSMHGIVILQDFRVVFANKAATEIPGLTMEELQNLSLEDMMAFVPPENRATIRERLKNRFAGKNEPANYELRLVRRNGEEFWLNLFFSPIEYQGRFAIQLAFTDITERLQAEKQLKQSQEFLSNAINALDDPFFAKDEEHRWAVLNDAACEVMGRPREELIGKSDYDLFAKEQADVFWERDNLVLKNGVTDVNEEEITWHGKSHIISTKKSVLTDSLTGKKFIVGTIRDITERKQAESALCESEKRLSLIYNTTTDIMILLKAEPNGESNIVTVNDGFMDYFAEAGIRKDTICNTSVRKFFQEVLRLKPEDIAYRLDRLREAANSKETVRFDLVTPLPNRTTITTETTLNPIVDERGECTHILAVIKDITERKKAEETLQESEERFRSLSESSPMGVFHTDKEGRVLYTNKRWQEITDMTLEESLGFGWSNALHPDEKKPLLEEWERCVSEEKDYSGEFRFVSKSGEVKWVYTKTAPIRSETGQVIGHVGSNEDITERKQAREALKESEEKYRAIVERAPDSIATVDLKGIITSCNNALLEQTGYSEQDFVGKHFLKNPTMRIRDIPKYLKIFRSLVTGKVPEPLELVGIYKDGSEHLGEVHISIIRKRGKIIGFQTMTRDITDRKRAEEALAASESKYRSLFDNSMEGIGLSKGNCVISANKALLDIFGYDSIEEFTRIPLLDHVAPESREIIRELMKKREKGELAPSSRFEHRILRKDGQIRDLEISRTAISIEGEQFTQSTFRDITEHKEAEEKLHEHQEQLKSLASELTLAEERERRRIAIDLHDEISQSLFISKMKLESLHKSASGKELNETLDEISNSLGRMIAGMRSLIFDLSSPILYELGFEEAVAEWLTEQVEEKYGIATEFEDDKSFKPLDDDIRVLLFRNVRELLINVVKHAHASKVKVSIWKVGGRIHISVEDDGLGFDTSKAETMITNKEAFGLFSIRERLEHFGGTFDIESSPGCGCRITITSPLKR
jgi:PAS domain S-box-containing protein